VRKNLEEIYYLLREHRDEILIVVGLTMFLIGMFSLTRLGSFLFVLLSYVSVVLLLIGILSKLGVFPSTFKSKSGLSVILLFTSTLCLTTTIISPFIHVELEISSWPMKGPVLLYGLPTMEQGDQYDWQPHCEGAYKPDPGIGICLRYPYTNFSLPLLKIGAVLFIIAIGIMCLDEFT